MILSPIIYWLSTAKVLCSFWNSTHRGLFNTKADLVLKRSDLCGLQYQCWAAGAAALT